MQSLRLSRPWLACALLTALLLATVTANAKNNLVLNGYYDLSGVVEQGDSVQVTLHLRLFNHGHADLKGVIVTLLDDAPTMALRGSFQPVKVWKKQGFIEMSKQFTVSKLQFKQWNIAPAQPNIAILYQDSNGNSVRQSAQISRRPLVKTPQEE